MLKSCTIVRNRKKALKRIPVGDISPDETMDADREAKLLSKLDHPFIMKLHDSFFDVDEFCIVTEYCEVRFQFSVCTCIFFKLLLCSGRPLH